MKIFGRPKKTTGKGEEILHHSIDITSDFKYSIKLKDGEAVYFALQPRSDSRGTLGVDNLLKILPYLKLIKSEHGLVQMRDMLNNSIQIRYTG